MRGIHVVVQIWDRVIQRRRVDDDEREVDVEVVKEIRKFENSSFLFQEVVDEVKDEVDEVERQ